MANKILFLTLKIFSATGGIEKVCRVVGKAIYEMSIAGNATGQVFCMHDSQADANNNKYFPSDIFHGFDGRRFSFIFTSLLKGRKSHTVILSHINLLLVGWLIKKIAPSTKIILFAHGIEVWELLSPRKKKMLACCDKIFAVSSYTSEKLQEMHQVPASKCKVLNNCLDPFLQDARRVKFSSTMRKKYGYNEQDVVLFTLTRLSSTEKYKGYDKVLYALATLKEVHPELRYLLAGSYDAKEKAYLDDLINELGLTDIVTIAGFIKEEELIDHFSNSNVYVMPSMKEGFGIVFIEAMFYGLPVIAGNSDGSVDALCHGKLGTLVDPLDVNAIAAAINRIMINKTAYIPDHKLLMNEFGYDTYKARIEKLIA